MQIFFLIILGLVQGLCEFLPISSSGHLVLLSSLFGIEDSLFVSIVLHTATLLAIIVVFRKDIWRMVRHPFSDESMKVVVATIPTCLIVLVLMPIINESFSGVFLPVCFAISAILLLFVERYTKASFKGKKFDYKQAFVMGVAQGFAVFPGLSRSGTTISAGLISGGEKGQTAKFSFIMSIPIIFLSMLLEIIKVFIYNESIQINYIGLSLSFIVAFVVGILSIKLMINLTTKSNFKWFSLYLIIMAILSILIL